MPKQTTKRARRIYREQHAHCRKLTVYDPRTFDEEECYCMFEKYTRKYPGSYEINADYMEPEGHVAKECPCIESNNKLRVKYLKKYQPESSSTNQITHNIISNTPITDADDFNSSDWNQEREVQMQQQRQQGHTISGGASTRDPQL